MSLARVEEAKLAYEQAMQLDGGAAVRAEAAQVPNAYIQAHMHGVALHMRQCRTPTNLH